MSTESASNVSASTVMPESADNSLRPALPKVSAVLYDLGFTISASQIANDTAAAPSVNQYVAVALGLPEHVARRVAWKLLLRAVRFSGGSEREARALLAARHLLGLVDYARTERGPFDRHVVIEGDTLTAAELHALGIEGVPFSDFDPLRFVGQRRLIAGRVGGWTERDRTGIAPRSGERHKTSLRELCDAVWKVISADLADPDVVQPLIVEARDELEVEDAGLLSPPTPVDNDRTGSPVEDVIAAEATSQDRTELVQRGELAGLAAETNPWDERAGGGNVFERFTERAIGALLTAQVEANTLGHSFIGAEHLFLGAIAEADGELADRLEGLGISVEKSRALVVERIGQGTADRDGRFDLAFAPHAKDAIRAAVFEAFGRSSPVVTISHLLLGLMSVDGISPLLLRRQMDAHAIEIVRREIGAVDR